MAGCMAAPPDVVVRGTSTVDDKNSLRKIDRKHFHVNYVECSTTVDAKTLQNSKYELN